MKKKFSILVAGVFLVGICLVIWGQQKAYQAVPIFAYHEISSDEEPYGISPEELEAQLSYLKEHGYQAISLQEYFTARQAGQALPEKAFIMTFDDGYRNNLTEALPIIQKYGYTFTIFMISSKIGQDNFLNLAELKQLQSQGVEIGSHTVHHLALADLSPEDKLKELKDSKLVLEEKLGQKVEFLAYPYGSHSSSIAQFMAEAGYQCGLTGKPGLNDEKTPPYLLKRINVPRPKFGLWEFRLRLWRSQALYVYQSLMNS